MMKDLESKSFGGTEKKNQKREHWLESEETWVAMGSHFSLLGFSFLICEMWIEGDLPGLAF